MRAPMVAALTPFPLASAANCCFHASKPAAVLPHGAASALPAIPTSTAKAATVLKRLRLIIRNSSPLAECTTSPFETPPSAAPQDEVYRSDPHGEERRKAPRVTIGSRALVKPGNDERVAQSQRKTRELPRSAGPSRGASRTDDESRLRSTHPTRSPPRRQNLGEQLLS